MEVVKICEHCFLFLALLDNLSSQNYNFDFRTIVNSKLQMTIQQILFNKTPRTWSKYFHL